MPSTPTLLGTVQNVGSGATSITYPSVSPTGNSLIVCILMGRTFGSTGITFNFSTVNNGQGEGYTFWNHEAGTPWDGTGTNTYGSGTIGVQVCTAVTTASPGSGTIVWTFGTSNRMKMWVYEITSDFDAAMPIRQWNFEGTGSSAAGLTDNLAVAPLTSSRLMAFGIGGFVGTTTVSEDTGWTEIDPEEANNHPGNVQHRTGTTSTQYGIGFSNTMDLGIAIGCIEIRADASIAEQPTVEQAFQQDVSATSTFTLPTTGSISPPANSWVLVPCMISDVGGTTRSVSSISSTFAVTGAGWQQIATSTAVGADAVLVEWWYAQCTATPGSGTVTITYSASYTGMHGGIIYSLSSTATDDPSAGTSGSATTASYTGGTSLTGTLGATPATDSILMCAGVAAGNSNQDGVYPATGYELVDPPASEGGNHTTQSAWSGGDIGTTFGGQMSKTGFDHADGAAFLAIEIPAVAGAVATPKGPLGLALHGPFSGPV